MKITILGARGSVPTDGRDMLEFGGATSCVLVETDDTALYLDAGTGIMSAPDLGDKNISIVLTHPHIDHMIGLPFFPALSKSGRRIDIYGSPRMGYTTKTQLERLLSPPLWPLFITDYPADTVIHDIDGDFNIGDIRIRSMESNHPGGGLVLRVEHGGKSVVLATDFEHDGEHIKMLTEFAKDTDLLLYDAQYTDEEYKHFMGYGHSTPSVGLELMKESGAKSIRFMHHDPRHTDKILKMMEEKIKTETVSFAREGEEILL
ncbi:MAG: MBL fold metallo-hydrolase [Lachnospiraceae bacterium]|nr:MBL fold metallo-hydrolase [Lachnospiraceae bacterium]